MKKKTIITIAIAGVLVLACIGTFFLIRPQKLDPNRISQIEFVSFPSPPKKKIVTKKDDINKICSTINELSLTPRISISNPSGTSVWINTSREQTTNITITGTIVQINKVSYNCNEDAAEKMRKLYQTFSYQEESYP